MFIRILVTSTLTFASIPASAAPAGIECRASDGSFLGINYAEQKLLMRGPITSDGTEYWARIGKETRVDASGTTTEEFFYNSGPWRETNSTHVLIVKSTKEINAYYHKVTLSDTCEPQRGFACHSSTSSRFSCGEVDRAPLPAPIPQYTLKFPVCDRTPEVRQFIERHLGLECEQITGAVLLKATFDEIQLSNLGLRSLKAGDLEGLHCGLVGKKILNLSHNNLESLPFNLVGLDGIELSDKQCRYEFSVVNLSYNRFTQVPLLKGNGHADAGWFDSSMNGSWLDLSHNQIDFRGYRMIDFGTSVDLSHNRIIELPQRLKVFGSIDLSHNQISNLNEGNSIEGRDRADLRFNPLRSVKGKISQREIMLGGLPGQPLDLANIHLSGRLRETNVTVQNCIANSVGFQFEWLWTLNLVNCKLILGPSLPVPKGDLIIKDSFIEAVDESIGKNYFWCRAAQPIQLIGSTSISKSDYARLTNFYSREYPRTPECSDRWASNIGNYKSYLEIEPTVQVRE